jgi:hypothetical protein
MPLPSVPRATGFGAAAGLVALLLWLGFAGWPSTFVLPYVLALGATALTGAYILLATLFDMMRNPRRGVRIRPIRGFDVAAGLVLLLPSAWALTPFLPAL